MSLSKFRKNLLAGTALVAASVFATPAYATCVLAGSTCTINGADQNVTVNPAFNPAINFVTNNTATVSAGVNIDSVIQAAAASTGILTFSGASAISGTVGVVGGNGIDTINGGVGAVTFNGQVDANTANLTGASTMTFNGTTGVTTSYVNSTGSLIYNGALTGDVTYNAAGAVSLNNVMTGNMDFTNKAGTVTIADTQYILGNVNASIASAGTVTFAGSGSITGTVGASNAISLINSGVAGSTVTFNSAVTAATVNLSGTGLVEFKNTLAAGAVNVTGGGGTVRLKGNASATNFTIAATDTIELAAAATISGAIDGSAAGNGILNITSTGSNVIAGIVGDTFSIGTINVGVTGSNTTFNNRVTATTANITGAGTTSFSDLLASNLVFGTLGSGTVNINNGLTGSVSFSNGSLGTVVVADGKDVTGTVDSLGTGAGGGTITFSGDSTITGIVGGASANTALSAINAGAANKTVNFNSAVRAATITLTAKGDINFNGAVIGDIVYGGDGKVNINAGLTGNVDFANKLGALNVADGQTITGTIDSTVGTTGTLNLLGSSTITGAVGINNPLLAINSGVNLSASTFTSNVAVDTFTTTGTGSTTFSGVLTSTSINYSGAGTVYITQNSTGNVDFKGNAGVLNIASGKIVTGTIGSSTATGGTLTLSGGVQTLANDVGGTKGLSVINAGAAGAVTTFSGTVTSVTTNVTGTGTVNFAKAITGNLAFGGAGTANLSDNITGSVDFANNAATVNLAAGKSITGKVDSTVGSNGTLNLSGGTQTISGTVGESKAVSIINTGVAGSVTNFSSNAVVTALNINDTGAVNLNGNFAGGLNFAGNGSVTIADAKNITGTVNNTSGGPGAGTLTLSGTTTVSGAVGATNTLLAVNAGAAGKTATFSSTVAATTINVTDTGKVYLNGAATGNLAYAAAGTVYVNAGLTGNVDFVNNAGILNVADAQNITGSIDSTIGSNGTVNFAGSSIISAAVGTSNAITAINANGVLGKKVVFGGAVNATTISTASTGEIEFQAGANAATYSLTAGSTVTTSGAGTLTGAIDGDITFNVGGTTTVATAVGAVTPVTTLNLATTTAAGFSSTVNATTANVTSTGASTFTGALTVTDLIYASTGTVNINENSTGNVDFAGNAGTLVMASGKVMVGTIDSTVASGGTLTLSGGAQTIANTVGATNALTTINAGAVGATSTFSSTVAATTLNVTGTGTVNLNQGLTGGIDFGGNAGVVNVTADKNVTGVVNSTVAPNGTLNMLGGTQTVSGIVGGTNAIAAVNAGAIGATTTFSSDVTATALTVTGTGAVNLNGNFTGALDFAADGSATVADAKNITGTVDNTTGGNGVGTLMLSGTTTVSGAVGATNSLKTVTAAAAGKVATFSSAVNASNVTMAGSGTLVFGAGVTAATFSTSSGGTIMTTGIGTVDAKINGAVTLDIGADTILAKTVGTTTPLTKVNLSTASLLTVNAGLGATTVNFGADGTISLADASNLTGKVTSTLTNTGTLTLAGSSTVTGAVGVSGGNVIKAVNVGAVGSTSSFSSTVNATAINVTGTGVATIAGAAGGNVAYAGAGTLSLNGGLTGNVDFAGNAGVLNVASGTTVSGTIDSSAPGGGTLNMNGGAQTLAGAIGATNALAAVNVSANGATTTFGSTLNATTTTVTGTGTLNLNGAATTNLNFAADGSASIAAGLTGALDNTSGVAGKGSVTFTAAAPALTTIGATNPLKVLVLGGNTSASGAVRAADATVVGNHLLTSTGLFTLGSGQRLSINASSGLVYGGVDASAAGLSIDANSLLTVSLNAGNTITDGDQLTIVKGNGAGGVANIPGANIGSSSRSWSFSQVLNANDLVIQANKTTAIINIGTENSDAVQVAINSGLGNADIFNLNTAINNAGSVTAADRLIESAMPAMDRGSISDTFEAGVAVQDLVTMHMAEIRSGEGLTGMSAGYFGEGASLWMQGYGSNSLQRAKKGITGYSSNLMGMAFGYDTVNIIEAGIVGLAVNYGKIAISSKDANATDTGIDNIGVNFYSSLAYGGIFIDTQLGFAHNSIQTNRYNVGGLAGPTAVGNNVSTQLTARLAFGAENTLDSGTIITPTFSLAYSGMQADGYTETGAGGLNLNIAPESYGEISTGVGLKLSWDIVNYEDYSWEGRSYSGAVFKPEVHFGYDFDVMRDRIISNSRFTGNPGAVFTTKGVQPTPHNFNMGMGLTYITTANWDFDFKYDYTYKESFNSYSGSMRLTTHL